MAGRDLNVLVVDDQSTMRKIMRGLLEQMGFPLIAEARDGCTALGKLQEAHFDLIISDWNMDAMTGLELLKEVRADNKPPSFPLSW
jgi:two-component system chemotaxis response regulator CheY